MLAAPGIYFIPYLLVGECRPDAEPELPVGRHQPLPERITEGGHQQPGMADNEADDELIVHVSIRWGRCLVPAGANPCRRPSASPRGLSRPVTRRAYNMAPLLQRSEGL